MLQYLVVPVEWKSAKDLGDALPPEWKADAADGNTLIGYASTFGNIDLGGDVVVPGAFTKSVTSINSGNTIPLLADHVASTASLLGSINGAKQDTAGLLIKARISSAPSAQDTAVKLREGHLSKLSIGYEPMDDAYEDRDGMKVRLLKDVKLWETSVVVFPMNPMATISSVKTMFGTLDANARAALVSELALPTPATDAEGTNVDPEKKATDPAAASALSQVMGWLAAVDNIVDEAQDQLADWLGVPNPDEDMPGDEGVGDDTAVALSPEDRNVMTQALGWIRAVDCIVDEAQESVADYLNVPNPDSEDDTDDQAQGAPGKSAPQGGAPAKKEDPNASDEPAAAPDEGASGTVWDRWKSAALLTDDNSADAVIDDLARATLQARLQVSEWADGAAADQD